MKPWVFLLLVLPCVLFLVASCSCGDDDDDNDSDDTAPADDSADDDTVTDDDSADDDTGDDDTVPVPTFSSPENISNQSENGSYPDVVATGEGRVVVAWYKEAPNSDEDGVYFAMDEGTGFSSAALAGSNDFWDRAPVSLGADADGGVHLAWAGNNNVTGYDLNYSFMGAGDSSFAVRGYIDQPLDIYDPVVRPSTDGVHFGYFADGGLDGWKDAFYAFWDGSFGAPALNLSYDSGSCSDVRVAVDASGPRVVWNDDSFNDAWEVLYKEFTGGSWSDMVNLTGDGPEVTGSYPDIIIVSGTVHVFYSSHAIMHLWNDGGGWQGPETLYTSNDAYWSRAAASPNGDLNLVFEDSVDPDEDGGYQWDVFYMGRYNGVWTAPVNVSNSAESSDYPAVAVDPLEGVIHIVWTEATVPSQIDHVQTLTNE